MLTPDRGNSLCKPKTNAQWGTKRRCRRITKGLTRFNVRFRAPGVSLLR
jgi:hypothetical protein